MFRSLCSWRDLSDGHLYQPGDPFPHDGREIPADRLSALLSGQNKAGLALIEEQEKETAGKPVKRAVKAAEAVEGNSTADVGEPPKKATRSRKKAI